MSDFTVRTENDALPSGVTKAGHFDNQLDGSGSDTYAVGTAGELTVNKASTRYVIAPTAWRSVTDRSPS